MRDLLAHRGGVAPGDQDAPLLTPDAAMIGTSGSGRPHGAKAPAWVLLAKLV
jgi:hypothetical protein